MTSGGIYLARLDVLTRKDLVRLLTDLLACAVIVCETGNTKPLRELMEGWDATLEVLADKPLMRRLCKARGGIFFARPMRQARRRPSPTPEKRRVDIKRLLGYNLGGLGHPGYAAEGSKLPAAAPKGCRIVVKGEWRGPDSGRVARGVA